MAVKSRRMRWMGLVAHMEQPKKYIQNFGQKTEVKRPIGRHRHIWEDNIKMDFREIRYNVDLIHLAQDKGQW
jgi:hypothetical protein